MSKSFASLLASLFVLGVLVQPTQAQVPGQVPLSPTKIPQFVDPLPHFAGARVRPAAPGNLTIHMVPHQQVIVSTGTKLATGTVGPLNPNVGKANLWVYQISTDGGTSWAGPAHYPAFTIEAQRDISGGNPFHVSYENKLVNQRYSDVGLVVDQTLHSALPMLPPSTVSPYTGPIPATVHLHGGEVPPESDGGPDSWFTPDAVATGHAYNPAPYLYPNTQEGATIWYHDHALGLTRLNVYAGLAGFYLLREMGEDGLQLPGWSGDGTVSEVDPVTGVVTRGPYLPEIEVAIQDRMFDANGGLYFPNLPTNPTVHPFWTPEFVGDVIVVNGKTWPYLSVAPRQYRFRLLNGSNARFYNLSFPKGGPTIMQIGTDGGFMDAPVALGNGPLLLAPGERADVIIDFSLFAPVVTKKGAKISSFILVNDARTPFPAGKTVNGNTTGRIMQFVVNGQMSGTPSTVTTAKNLRPGSPLVRLTNFNGSAIAPVAKTRQLTLNEVMGAGGPLEILVNNTKWHGLSVETGAFPGGVRSDFTGMPNGDGSSTYYSEMMNEGETEIWQIINLTADAHPIHLHLVQFQLMSRQPFNVKGYNAAYNALFPGSATAIDPMTGAPYLPGVFMGGYGPPNSYIVANADGAFGGNPAVSPFLVAGTARPALPNENGWKDTFIMYPGEVTTVIARWAPTDKPATDPVSSLYFAFNPDGGHGYVWHCHIIDHEDNEMMRPYSVSPNVNASRAFARVAFAQQVAVASEKPIQFGLDQNYPNPFNPTTEIRFSVPENSRVVLKLYNALGQEVQTLVNNDVPAGKHSVSLNASRLASGTYFYRLQAGNNVAIKKMMLVK
jgi:spore coat protein A, manganese oxidase